MKPYDLPYDAELLEAEQQLENESIDLGIDRYKSKLESNGEATTGPGKRLLKQIMGPLAEAISEFQEKGRSGKPGRDIGKAKFLLQFDPLMVAFVTARTAIQSVDQRVKAQSVAMQISQLLEDTVHMEDIKEQTKDSPRVYHYLQERIKKSGSAGSHRHFIIKSAVKRHEIVSVKWGQSERLGLGMVLLKMLETATGAILLVQHTVTKADTPIYLEASAETREWLNKGHDNAAILQPFRCPMVIPPVPWTSLIGGGYLTRHLKYPAITGRNNSLREELKSWEMPKVYRALNALQETPWAVNKEVLTVLDQVWSEGGQLGKLPSRDNIPLPVQNYESPEADPEAHTLWKRAARDIHEKNAHLVGKRFTLSRKISLSKKFSEFEAIYFPHVMDWRGRMYPVATFLNPQGDDVAKGLLKFSQGKKLGEKGLYWLAVHGANCAGVDKVSFDNRVQWVRDNHEAILDSAINPLDGGRFWSTLESPWQFLAFCFEWLGASIQGEAFVSHLSVSWDGSCNGLQNYSAMLRDEVGGKATNLIPSETPSDIYTEVKDEAEELLPPASPWKGKLTRGLAKRPTMTKPYAASKFGFTEQIFAELQDLNDASPNGRYLEHGDDFKSSSELASVIDVAIGNVVVKAKEAMDWLKEVAKVAASDKLPIYWEAPSGFLVVQDYRVLQGQRFSSVVAGQRFQLMLSIESDSLDTKKQANGIAPNFIHSMDASHMVNTINRCLDRGITGLAMIHDSYGTHAADAEALSYELREAFIEQYTPDVLGGFLEQIKGQLPEELHAKLPPRPELGKLDLEQVRDSKYFFA